MKWKLSKKITKSQLSKLKGIDDITAQLLINRDIVDLKTSRKFLDPSIKNLYDSFDLYDVKGAAKRVEKAIKDKEKIFIHGDYDVDGMTSTALLWDYLYRERGADVTPYMPSRVDEGYGLSEESVANIKKEGADLIISVDCGIRDFELVDKEKVDFIVIDHHQPGEKISKKAIIVHPMYPRKEYPFPNISGCAVTWKFICAMEKLRDPSKFKFENVKGIDLVALSTVTDIMPLKDENRIFVALGIAKMKKDMTLGLESLVNVAQIDKESLDTYHLGFVIGPRFNAAGRIGDPMDGVRLLSTHDEKVAERLAIKLTEVNTKRQEMTETVMKEVTDITAKSKDEFLYFAQNDKWPEGIIGLAAGKVLEEVYRPVIVVTGDGDVVRGSARSIVEFDITEAIENFGDILEKYGGHSQAAGFSIKRKNLKKFEEGMKKLAMEKLKDLDLTKELKIDMKVDAADINWDIVKIIEKLQPFGVGNRKPVFQVDGVVVVSTQSISEGKHLKLSIKNKDSDYISCIFFNAGEWVEKLKPGSIIDIVGVPESNVWNGEEKLQFNVRDIRESK